MQDKKELINFLTLINESNKNHKNVFTEFQYNTISGNKAKIYVKELKQIPKFIEWVTKARESNDPENQWRVDIPSSDYLNECKIYRTWGGCTFAIRPDGNIIAVCGKVGENGHSVDNMESVMAYAVEECKKLGLEPRLDSFDGNWRFYAKCGFEPKTYIPFDDSFADEIGWDKNRDDPEPVVFFGYTDNKRRLDKESVVKEMTDFYVNNKPITMNDAIEGEEYEYDVAYRIRNEMMEKENKQKNIMPKYSTILKVIEESITKTHDGTSMSGLNSKIKNIARIYATDDNLHYFAYDEKGGLVSSITSYNQYRDKYKDEQFDALYHHPQNLDLIRNLGHEDLDKHNPSYYDSKYEYEDMYATLNGYDLDQLRNIGEDSSFRSFTMVSPNGSSITFIKNNNYTEKDNELFTKLAYDFEDYCTEYVSKCENDTQDIRAEIIEKGDKEHGDYTWRVGSDDTKRILDESVKESVKRNGTLYDAIKEYPRLSQFEECNIKVRIRSKESNK